MAALKSSSAARHAGSGSVCPHPVKVQVAVSPDTDKKLNYNDIVRVYDVLMGYSDCLMATDEILLNPGGQRFRVVLTEPQKGQRYERSLRAAVQVAVPDGEERFNDEFHNGKTLTTDDVIYSINRHRGEESDSIIKAWLEPITEIKKDGDDVTLKPDPAAPLAAQVFKTRIDPFVQKLSFIRVFSGTLKKDSTVPATGARKGLKIA